MSESAAGGAGGGGKRTGLRHPLEHYAREYDSSPRTVKRWRGIGEEAGDSCPLDDPEAMVAWWSRHMTQRTPQGIESARLRARKSGVSAPAPVARPLPAVKVLEGELPLVPGEAAAVAAPIDPAPMDLAAGEKPPEKPMPEGRGLLAELGRLEELAASLSRRADEPGQAKAYLDTVARMGTLTAKLREEGERLGKLLPRDQAEAAIHEFHGPIVVRVRSMFAAMCQILGIPATPEAEDAWNDECDRTFSRLKEEVFAA